jgi:hypothetical protein
VNLAGAALLSVRFLTDAARSTGSSAGRRRTFPSSPCGPRRSWSCSRRCSASPEGSSPGRQARGSSPESPSAQSAGGIWWLPLKRSVGS